MYVNLICISYSENENKSLLTCTHRGTLQNREAQKDIKGRARQREVREKELRGKSEILPDYFVTPVLSFTGSQAQYYIPELFQLRFCLP